MITLEKAGERGYFVIRVQDDLVSTARQQLAVTATELLYLLQILQQQKETLKKAQKLEEHI